MNSEIVTKCHNCESEVPTNNVTLDVFLLNDKTDTIVFYSTKCRDVFASWFENVGHLG